MKRILSSGTPREFELLRRRATPDHFSHNPRYCTGMNSGGHYATRTIYKAGEIVAYRTVVVNPGEPDTVYIFLDRSELLAPMCEVVT